jgi:uncharacterized membrane protein YedE/YeeE
MTCFYSGTLNQPEGLLAATLIGLAFGFWLERAGFGSSRKLTSIFYFRDFAVLKVMFTAIVTAAIGLYFFSAAGMVSLEEVFQPATFLWPQIVGGLLFGVGFVVGGYCPGTAIVATASAKADAIVFLVGAGIGSLAFGFAHPALADFMTSGSMGNSTLPVWMGIDPALVTFLVTVVALGAFALVTWVEKTNKKRASHQEV